MVKKERGITLIALVITIIVLLILAGITIAALSGENGILTRATEARDKTIETQEEEEQILKEMEDYIDESIEGGTEQIEPTDVYATLYTDNTLAFSSTQETIADKTPQEGKSWNITGQEYSLDSEALTVNTPWYDDAGNIQTVVFVDDIVPISVGAWFAGFTNLTSIDLNGLNTTNVTDMSNMFLRCTSLKEITFGNDFNTSNVRNMTLMFGYCGMEELNLSSFNTSKVENMTAMFEGCHLLETLTFGENFNTRNVKNMSYMFNICQGLGELDLSNFNTSNVTDMSFMFYRCSNLRNIIFGNGFNTGNVNDMQCMFSKCTILEELDLSSFNTSNVTDMGSIFANCEGLTSITFGNNFDTSNVEMMEGMFGNCKSLTKLDLTSFNTAKATSRNVMFMKCESMQQILVGEGWTEPSEADLLNMFRDCGVSDVTRPGDI